MENTENLAMLSELALASLVLPNLINPALDKVKAFFTIHFCFLHEFLNLKFFDLDGKRRPIAHNCQDEHT